jgi:hypothetical protein
VGARAVLIIVENFAYGRHAFDAVVTKLPPDLPIIE